jgi:Fe-S-cluster containining protein
MNLCNQCGACCRTIALDQSPEEVRGLGALTAVFGIPSDHTFAAAHWRPLTRAEALAINPFYVSRLPATKHFYACDQLGADGRCLAHATRPLVCRGYPWYDQPVREMPLADPLCGYAYEQVRDYVIRREDL